MTFDFDKIFESILKNNRHAAYELGKIHGTVLKLIENINGIVPNQEHTYKLNETKFEIATHADELYLLPTMEHLDEVIKLTKEPSTEVKTLSEPNQESGLREVIIQKFSDAYKGPLFGCPLFGAKRMDKGITIKLEDEFFDNMNRIIQDVVIPKKTESKLVLF